MPEYLAPGVYVEEVSFRSKTIEGVSTTTTGFIGPSAYGPLDMVPEILTSLEEFERIYGPGNRLIFTDATGSNPSETDNYLWHGVRAFFAEGGRRLYISRTFLKNALNDGYARTNLPVSAAADADALNLKARFPGSGGNVAVRFTLRLGGNVLGMSEGKLTVGALVENDVVWVADTTSPFSPPAGSGAFYQASRDPNDPAEWIFKTNPADSGIKLSALSIARGDRIRIVGVSVTMAYAAPTAGSVSYDVGLDPTYRRNGIPNSLFDVLEENPTDTSKALNIPISITRGANIDTGMDILNALFTENTALRAALLDPLEKTTDVERSADVRLRGGNDGQRPTATEYEGNVNTTTNLKSGLKAFEDLEDISIVAAPGSTFGY